MTEILIMLVAVIVAVLALTSNHKTQKLKREIMEQRGLVTEGTPTRYLLDRPKRERRHIFLELIIDGGADEQCRAPRGGDVYVVSGTITEQLNLPDTFSHVVHLKRREDEGLEPSKVNSANWLAEWAKEGTFEDVTTEQERARGTHSFKFIPHGATDEPKKESRNED